MQNVMHIATNAGHTAQNDGQTRVGPNYSVFKNFMNSNYSAFENERILNSTIQSQLFKYQILKIE